jgi:hypothetical protein
MPGAGQRPAPAHPPPGRNVAGTFALAWEQAAALNLTGHDP